VSLLHAYSYSNYGMLVEKEIWEEVFNAAREIYTKYLRGPDDWERVKTMIAAKVSSILRKYFATIEKVALIDLSGGECVEGERGSFDIDMIFKVGSAAEAYALSQLESIIDNALKEAFVFTVKEEVYRMLLRKYGRGLNHNIVEFHINNEYALKLAESSICPAIEL